MTKRGIFITFEGGDGCGKSTQAGMLASALRKKGYRVVRTREPGGSLFSEHLRDIILDPRHTVVPEAELLLYEASRAGHTQEIIKPSLEEGKIVICERYSDATIAYQGYGRGLSMKNIKYIDDFATGGIRPDVTLYMKMPAGKSLGRIKGKKDRLELEKLSFHKRVEKGYSEICKRNPSRVTVIEAAGSREKIHKQILKAVLKKLKK